MTYITPDVQIDRNDLVDTTERITKSYKDQFPELVNELLQVAKNTKYICVGPDWETQDEIKGYGKCGCLVGTYRMGKELTPEPWDSAEPDFMAKFATEEDRVMYIIGVDFLGAIRDNVREYGDLENNFYNPYIAEIID